VLVVWDWVFGWPVPCGELVDRLGVAVDQVQVHPGEKPVVLGKPTLQCLGQLRDLGPQPAFGQLCQRGGVTIAGDQRF
jgi:hypothetical protein